MGVIDVDHLVAGLREYFLTPEMVALVDQLTTGGFKLSKLVIGVSLVVEAVKKVEELVADVGEVGAGGAKKEAVVKFLDDCVDLPFWAEPFDDNIFSLIVDGIVVYFNLKLGHGWLTVIKGVL